MWTNRVRLAAVAGCVVALGCGDGGTRPSLGANVVIRSASQQFINGNYAVALNVENTGGAGSFYVAFRGINGLSASSEIAVTAGYSDVVGGISGAPICEATVKSRPSSSTTYRVTDSRTFGCVFNPP